MQKLNMKVSAQCVKQFGGPVSPEQVELVTVGVAVNAIGSIMPPIIICPGKSFAITSSHKDHSDVFGLGTLAVGWTLSMLLYGALRQGRQTQ